LSLPLASALCSLTSLVCSSVATGTEFSGIGAGDLAAEIVATTTGCPLHLLSTCVCLLSYEKRWQSSSMLCFAFLCVSWSVFTLICIRRQ
jgi:hypothetical protein